MAHAERARLPLAPTETDDLRLELARALLRVLGIGAVRPGVKVADLCTAAGIEVRDLDYARRIEAQGTQLTRRRAPA